jgi:heme/copper-type cytochrome/quinol oxidase subunit 3
MAVPAVPDETPVPSLAEAPPPAPLRPRVAIVGTAFASAAVATVILSLIGIYLARRADVVNSGGRWIPQGANIPLPQPTMILVTLIISIFTVLWAAHALRIVDRTNAYVALAVTLLLGFAAFNQATYLLSGLDLAVATEAGLLILTISGLWLAWLLTALIYLALMAFRALGGQYRRIPDGVEAAAFYWISNTAVWAVIWIAIYVMK